MHTTRPRRSRKRAARAGSLISAALCGAALLGAPSAHAAEGAQAATPPPPCKSPLVFYGFDLGCFVDWISLIGDLDARWGSLPDR